MGTIVANAGPAAAAAEPDAADDTPAAELEATTSVVIAVATTDDAVVAANLETEVDRARARLEAAKAAQERRDAAAPSGSLRLRLRWDR